jgi:hypothetical protein
MDYAAQYDAHRRPAGALTHGIAAILFTNHNFID